MQKYPPESFAFSSVRGARARAPQNRVNRVNPPHSLILQKTVPKGKGFGTLKPRYFAALFAARNCRLRAYPFGTVSAQAARAPAHAGDLAPALGRRLHTRGLAHGGIGAVAAAGDDHAGDELGAAHQGAGAAVAQARPACMPIAEVRFGVGSDGEAPEAAPAGIGAFG